MNPTLRNAVLAAATLGFVATSATAQTKLSLWHIWDTTAAQGKIYEEYAKEFEAANSGVEVEMVVTPHANYFQRLTAAIASGEGPDVFALTYRRLLDFESNDVLSPIDDAAAGSMGHASVDALREAWAPGSLESYQVGDTFYGVPLQFNIYAWIINATHFREAGLDPVADAPKTWDDVHAVAEKLVQKDDNGRITRQAISFPFVASAAWYLLEFEPVLRELGGSILNEDQTESLVNSEAAVKTMETIKRRFELGVSDKDIAASLDYYNDGFPTGKFSMTIGGNWGIPRWVKNFEGVVEESDFLAIPTPTFAGGQTATSTTGWAWVVFNGSDNKEAAWKLADSLTSQPARHLEQTGDIIPRAGWSESEAAKSIPQAAFWENMLQYSQPLAKIRNYSEVSEILKKAMEEILLSDKDIKETLDRAKADIDAVLQRG